ncbi:MAG: ATP-grasp domain-containing protein [Clostridium sp.]|nr:ATP-grasp domain-containing protein [Clostridium sp.]
MRIAVVTDQKRASLLQNEEGILEDEIKASVSKAVAKVLSKQHDVIELMMTDNFLTVLEKEKVDLVFNLCNGIEGESRISALPFLLDYAKIAYTGAGPVPHGLAYNKIYSGHIFKGAGIPTPSFYTVNSAEEIKSLKLNYPVLVKPKDEGSSRGIHDDSLVYNEEALFLKIKENLVNYNPPMMITEYIEGREFTVGVLGEGENIKVLPILEIDFTNLPSNLNKIYSFEAKYVFESYVKYHLPARLEDELKEKIETMAKKAFNSLDLRDYSRIDFRVKDGIPYVIEINSLPGLHKESSDIVKMAFKAGLSYEDLIMTIAQNGLNRANINNRNKDQEMKTPV